MGCLVAFIDANSVVWRRATPETAATVAIVIMPITARMKSPINLLVLSAVDCQAGLRCVVHDMV